MPKTKVTRDVILEAALRIIIRDGHEALNIKTVSAELGYSTQTISWTFGNMKGFREEVLRYAHEYVNKKMRSDSTDAIEEYGRVGIVYIDMAYDEPNLIRCLRSDEKRFQAEGGFGQSLNEAVMHERHKTFASQHGCTVEEAKSYMLDMMIYTQGLVSAILSGVLRVERAAAYKMLVAVSDSRIESFNKR